jgi:hypothetical protein
MEKKVVKTSEIKIQVGLNENNVPVRMRWNATDGNIENEEARAFLFSVWDPNQ